MEPFKILPSYKLLIYIICKYCVFINEIPTHFKDQYRQFIPVKR